MLLLLWYVHNYGVPSLILISYSSDKLLSARQCLATAIINITQQFENLWCV